MRNLDTQTEEFREYLGEAPAQMRLDLPGSLVCILDGQPGATEPGYTVYWTDGLASDYATWCESLAQALHLAATVVAGQE